MNPIQWNVLAIFFILGFMPFATAFISNAGANSEEAWVSSIEIHDQALPAQDPYSNWVQNGGLNMTGWYNQFSPSGNVQYADCFYIKDSRCEGVNNDTVYAPELWKGIGSIGQPYPGYNVYSSDDYFPIRANRGLHQSHFDPTNTYAGRSGSEIFAWNLSSKYNNEISQGETLDSIRYWMVSNDAYSCNHDHFANITFDGTIAFKYGNDILTFTNFEFSKNTKFQYQQLDEVHGNWDSVCGVGWIIEFDLTGFESLELHSFNGAGDWDNTSIYLELTNFVNEEAPNDFAATKLPFAGTGYWTMGVQHREINPVEAGFMIKTGTLILSVLTFITAIASTTYWNPFKDLVSNKGGFF